MKFFKHYHSYKTYNMSQKIIIKKNDNIKPLEERTPEEKVIGDAQLRVAILGQLFIEALEDFKEISGIEIIKKQKISSTINYCEKGIKPLYDAYYTHGNISITRAVENEYENAIKIFKSQKTFGSYSVVCQTLLARSLDRDTMDGTVHRILKKNDIKFLK